MFHDDEDIRNLNILIALLFTVAMLGVVSLVGITIWVYEYFIA